jgi:uncharacterized membrane protein
MFASFEIAGFVGVLLISAIGWRQNPQLLLKVTLLGGRYLLAMVALLLAGGLPVFLFRFGHVAPGVVAGSQLAIVHHFLGHWFVVIFVLYWPVLFVVSLSRPKSIPRKILLSAAAVACLFLFLFASFSGYLLPHGMPRPVDARERIHA